MTLSVDFVAEKPGNNWPSFGRNRFLFPLIHYGRSLCGIGIRLHFISPKDFLSISSGQVLCLDSRVFTDIEGHVSAYYLELLSKWKEHYDLVVWFDNRDSAGTTQFEVLPYVNRYAKKQFYRDTRLYMQPLYAGRLHTDYIHCKHGVDDICPEIPVKLNDLNEAKKFRLSWNLAYSDYRSLSHFDRYANFALGFRPPKFYDKSTRTIDIHARYTDKYTSKTISYHRQQYLLAVEKLKRYSVSVRQGHTSLRKYKEELRNSHAILSPFGWGEICYRDFEAMQNSCALIKPNMEHLVTWPDLFHVGTTYLELPWDSDGADIALEQFIKDYSLLREVGHKGQQEFKSIWDRQGGDGFIRHFWNLIDPG